MPLEKSNKWIDVYYDDFETEFLPIQTFPTKEEGSNQKLCLARYMFIPPFKKCFYPSKDNPPNFAADLSKKLSAMS